jgi:hypothetical protein
MINRFVVASLLTVAMVLSQCFGCSAEAETGETQRGIRAYLERSL